MICISMCTGFVCWACSHKEPQQQERVRQAFVAVKAAADKAKTTVQVSGGVVGWSVGLWLSLIFLHNFLVRLVISAERQKIIKSGFLGFTWEIRIDSQFKKTIATCSFHWALSWSLNIFRTFRPLPRLPWHDPPCRMKPVWSQVGAIEMMVVLTGDYILQMKMPWNINRTWNMNEYHQTQIHEKITHINIDEF